MLCASVRRSFPATGRNDDLIWSGAHGPLSRKRRILRNVCLPVASVVAVKGRMIRIASARTALRGLMEDEDLGV